jgi:hypothetical protein
LIGSAPHSPRLHFNDRLHVIKRRSKHFERIVAGLLLNDIEGPVANALRGALLPTRHQNVQKFPDKLVPIPHIRKRIAVV